MSDAARTPRQHCSAQPVLRRGACVVRHASARHTWMVLGATDALAVVQASGVCATRWGACVRMQSASSTEGQ